MFYYSAVFDMTESKHDQIILNDENEIEGTVLKDLIITETERGWFLT